MSKISIYSGNMEIYSNITVNYIHALRPISSILFSYMLKFIKILFYHDTVLHQTLSSNIEFTTAFRVMFDV